MILVLSGSTDLSSHEGFSQPVLCNTKSAGTAAMKVATTLDFRGLLSRSMQPPSDTKVIRFGRAAQYYVGSVTTNRNPPNSEVEQNHHRAIHSARVVSFMLWWVLSIPVGDSNLKPCFYDDVDTPSVSGDHGFRRTPIRLLHYGATKMRAIMKLSTLYCQTCKHWKPSLSLHWTAIHNA
jgi:hypothetical protein